MGNRFLLINFYEKVTTMTFVNLYQTANKS